MITLLTDFGQQDHFVGVLKGVIATLAPTVPVVDITHEVPAFSILEGAFLLEQSWRYFPVGTIHVAIVDPGVGSSRRALLIEAAGHRFVGPDNGLFSFLLGLDKVKVRSLEKPRFWLPNPSSTFHGRDIFAPVAAHLAIGVRPAQMGPLIKDPIRSYELRPTRLSRRAWTGSVLHVDRFGNLISNYRIEDFPDLRNRPFTLTVGLSTVELFASTYAYCPDGQLCVIPGSTGFYEIAISQGNASRLTGLVSASPLELTIG